MEAKAAADYTLEDLGHINCSIIKDESHRTYVNAMIKYHLVNALDTTVRDTLKSGKCVIFFFDGASDNTLKGMYTDYKRYHFSAVCVVVKLVDGIPQITYMDDFTSTIPDNPRKPSLNEGTPVPTVVDGIMPVTTTNHGGRYAALHLECHNTNDVIRCTETSSYNSSSVGINIHARSWDYVNSSTYSSTGCFNVGKSVEAGGKYNDFMLAVAGIKNAYYNKFSSTGAKAGVAVIDHTLYAEQLKDIYKSDNVRTAEEIVDVITAYTRSLGVNTELFGAEGHVHTFSDPVMEDAHPHRSYRVCECGYAEVLDNGSKVSDCDICSPIANDKTYSAVLPFVCYLTKSGKVQSYSNAYMNKNGVTLDTNNEYTVDRVYNTGACRIAFMSSGRMIEAFVPLSDVVASAESGLKKENAKNQITTYTRPGGAEYGYVGKGDDVYCTGEKSGMTQLFYPISGGKYKLGWVYTSAIHPQEYKITFAANGGKNAPGVILKQSGVNVNIPSVTPTRDGYVFRGWNTSADGSGTEYQPYAVYKKDANVTLYAMWEEIPEEPSVEESSEEPSVEEPSEEISEEASEEISEIISEEISDEISEEMPETESLPEKAADSSETRSSVPTGSSENENKKDEAEITIVPWIIFGGIAALAVAACVFFIGRRRIKKEKD